MGGKGLSVLNLFKVNRGVVVCDPGEEVGEGGGEDSEKEESKEYEEETEYPDEDEEEEEALRGSWGYCLARRSVNSCTFCFLH